MNPINLLFARLCVLATSLAGVPALAQVPANGSFEAGNPMTSWTIGGDTRAGAVRTADISGGTLVVPDGSWVAAISTGPNARTSGPVDFDGFGGNNDYDISYIESTFAVGFSPAFIAFDWGFASNEQDEQDQFDDLMDVKVDGTRIFSRSSCKNNGSSYSPFPNASCQNANPVNQVINSPAALATVALTYGPPVFQRVCLQLPDAAIADGTATLRFSVADGNDRAFDSTQFVDNVQLKTSCNEVGSIVQLTNTTGSFVEIKNGAPIFRAASARLIASDATGTNVAFATSQNLGANPNLLDQVYVWNGTAFTRLSGLTVQSGGQIQGIALSAQLDGAIRGRYLAIAAKLTETDNTEIYRYDRNTNTLLTITNTTGCDNTNPTIDGDGNVIAFESTCSAFTGAGTTKKIAVWNGTTTSTNLFGTTACEMAEPALTKNANGRYLAFKSKCVHNGANADANFEIYRFDRGNSGGNSGTTAGNFTRITNTTTNGGAGATLNMSPVLDGTTTGTNIYFLSDGNLTPTAAFFNADFSQEIFRYEVGAGTPLTQRTTSSDSIYVGVDTDIDGNVNYSYERISLLNFTFSVGRRRVNTPPTADSENNLATGTSIQFARIGRDGIVPVVNFLSSENFLTTNADGNTEVWQGECNDACRTPLPCRRDTRGRRLRRAAAVRARWADPARRRGSLRLGQSRNLPGCSD
ncbi:hypothetical protein [Tahibacter amnicola]|uniref:WD40 repeat protein n=1 Tax=Tahibacter amnicola TaxID=2976241 RepID=A0ABY6BHR9_9GAMM|nr:hypothetical protein [Tahibacter amnicola]UXI67407.1 hypothetical protein N4264_22145 [Tahibacter amnicola]